MTAVDRHADRLAAVVLEPLVQARRGCCWPTPRTWGLDLEVMGVGFRQP